MTDKELAAIQQRVSNVGENGWDPHHLQYAQVVGLLGEVERFNDEARRMTALHARTLEELDEAARQNAALRAVLDVMAASVVGTERRTSDHTSSIRFEGLDTASDVHQQVRALLVQLHPSAAS